ncbi:hypothetical protein DL95DRAFT_464800 [Leptodontidium sp. 2 PMI_412]|nr:hypothetical protein DL95DRAFT_464800 [Leptodontidium sp. 2 PMI_412]
MASKGGGRNVPMATMLSQLSKLSIDESSCLDSFKVFDKLPFELRIKIWSHACLEPRVVLLVPTVSQGAVNVVRTIPSQHKMPAVLEASRESRYEAKKYYAKVRERIYLQSIFFPIVTPPANAQPSQQVQSIDNNPIFTFNSLYVNFKVDHFKHRDLISAAVRVARRSFTPPAPMVMKYFFEGISKIQILDQMHNFHIPQPIISTNMTFFYLLESLKELNFIQPLSRAATFLKGMEDNVNTQLRMNDRQADILLENIRAKQNPMHLKKTKFNTFVVFSDGTVLGPVRLLNEESSRSLHINDMSPGRFR